ncbi:MAG: hypothetical protein JXP36_01545 [Bacteroidales bacterium]|nr:hypothetical protein [Bacteroidales bacterium]
MVCTEVSYQPTVTINNGIVSHPKCLISDGQKLTSDNKPVGRPKSLRALMACVQRPTIIWARFFFGSFLCIEWQRNEHSPYLCTPCIIHITYPTSVPKPSSTLEFVMFRCRVEEKLIISYTKVSFIQNKKNDFIVNFVKNKSYTVMNAAEIKLDLFRRLDKLDSSKLEKVYNKIINLINADTPQTETLSPEIKAALDEALESSKKGRVFTHEEVMKKSKEKFPNLFK